MDPFSALLGMFLGGLFFKTQQEKYDEEEALKSKSNKTRPNVSGSNNRSNNNNNSNNESN